MTDKATGKFVGRCALKSKCPGDREMEIVLARAYWRQGLGFEVGLRLIRLAFEDPTIGGVVGVVHPENLAGQGLMKKLGMMPTSKYEDPDYPRHIVFKISRAAEPTSIGSN
jgi:RimJ/RimL family protein N-acetyltransferase